MTWILPQLFHENAGKYLEIHAMINKFLDSPQHDAKTVTVKLLC
jgi:hypothetical protein